MFLMASARSLDILLPLTIFSEALFSRIYYGYLSFAFVYEQLLLFFKKIGTRYSEGALRGKRTTKLIRSLEGYPMKLKELTNEPALKRIVWKALDNMQGQPQEAPMTRVKTGMQLSTAFMRMRVQWLMKREGIGRDEAIAYLKTQVKQSKLRWARTRTETEGRS